jgi:hypothetical protein
MGNADSGIGFVDMLPPLAARPECVDPQIIFLNIDFYFIIDFWINKYGGKGCMPPGSASNVEILTRR